MGLPRTTFLNRIPAALHVAVHDADGEVRDGVVVSAEYATDLSDYGIARHGYGDIIFVAAPFKVPAVKITLVRDGVQSVRRITAQNANPVFVQIEIGEDYA